MQRKVLRQNFFNRDTKTVAKELLGKFLVRSIHGKQVAAMIIETEAYDGPHDLASHASKGLAARTQVMFGHPGHFYVYLIYGMHEMLNIVTREHGYPGAVLIRGIATQTEKLHGPGKVTKFMKINRALNGKKAVKPTGLWVEDRGTIPTKIKKLSRVGIAYAGPIWANKKLRFIMEA